MKKVLYFWLGKGIAGFRLDAINHMFEHISMADEPLSGWTNDTESYDYLNHELTKDQVSYQRKLLNVYLPIFYLTAGNL